jgi:hypothetical protein
VEMPSFYVRVSDCCDSIKKYNNDDCRQYLFSKQSFQEHDLTSLLCSFCRVSKFRSTMWLYLKTKNRLEGQCALSNLCI